MEAQRFHDLVADRVDRRKRGHRLLEDHGDVAPADGPDLPPARIELDDIDGAAVRSVQSDRAGGDATRRIDNLQDRARRDGLARPAFPDDAERLSGQRKVDGQVLDLQQWAGGIHGNDIGHARLICCRDRPRHAGHRREG